MQSENYDWGEFSISFFYPVDPSAAYDAWATAAGLESFFIERAEFRDDEGKPRGRSERVQAGDSYQWSWRHDHELSGQILDADPDRLVSFTFGTMACTVTFADAGNGTTLVRLDQRDIADDAAGRVLGHLNCRSCWVFFMTNLTSILLTGTDLRDTDPDRVSSMEVGYEPQIP